MSIIDSADLDELRDRANRADELRGLVRDLTSVLASRNRRIEELQAAASPFMRYYDDIRFNLRKQPHPTDTAIEERGERCAQVTWAEFYAFRDAFKNGPLTGK